MFTGIIEELGTIRGVSLTKDGGELQIAATTVLGGTKLGDSIAVNGTCLTVTKLEKDGFTAFVMAESLRRTNLGNLKRGSVVHLERAMAADGRFGGHIPEAGGTSRCPHHRCRPGNPFGHCGKRLHRH